MTQLFPSFFLILFSDVFDIVIKSGIIKSLCSFSGTTTTTSDHSTKWINSCGTIFGVTDSSVTVWAAAGAGKRMNHVLYLLIILQTLNVHHHKEKFQWIQILFIIAIVSIFSEEPFRFLGSIGRIRGSLIYCNKIIPTLSR